MNLNKPDDVCTPRVFVVGRHPPSKPASWLPRLQILDQVTLLQRDLSSHPVKYENPNLWSRMPYSVSQFLLHSYPYCLLTNHFTNWFDSLLHLECRLCNQHPRSALSTPCPATQNCLAAQWRSSQHSVNERMFTTYFCKPCKSIPILPQVPPNRKPPRKSSERLQLFFKMWGCLFVCFDLYILRPRWLGR